MDTENSAQEAIVKTPLRDLMEEQKEQVVSVTATMLAAFETGHVTTSLLDRLGKDLCDIQLNLIKINSEIPGGFSSDDKLSFVDRQKMGKMPCEIKGEEDFTCYCAQFKQLALMKDELSSVLNKETQNIVNASNSRIQLIQLGLTTGIIVPAAVVGAAALVCKDEIVLIGVAGTTFSLGLCATAVGIRYVTTPSADDSETKQDLDNGSDDGSSVKGNFVRCKRICSKGIDKASYYFNSLIQKVSISDSADRFKKAIGTRPSFKKLITRLYEERNSKQ